MYTEIQIAVRQADWQSVAGLGGAHSTIHYSSPNKGPLPEHLHVFCRFNFTIYGELPVVYRKELTNDEY